ALVEFDSVPLAIVEADRLDELMAIERQGKTGRRILAAGKQHQRAAGGHCEALAKPVSSGSKTRNRNGKELAFISALSRRRKMNSARLFCLGPCIHVASACCSVARQDPTADSREKRAMLRRSSTRRDCRSGCRIPSAISFAI